MRTILIIAAVLLLILGGWYIYREQQQSIETAEELDELGITEGRQINPRDQGGVTGEKIRAANFEGPLESIDTGCFADGECFAVVDGKRVTTMRGFSQTAWGQIHGVPGFGDLEGHIGKTVEVYAQDNGDGTYTLEGSEGFYLRLK
jgi:hypothetical protein